MVSFRSSLFRALGETLALLSLLLHPGRNRARAVYRLISTHNHPGETRLYLNLGSWRQARTCDEAGAELALRLADAAGLGRGDVVLDVGLGFGDQDRLWLERYGPERIVGINVSPEQVEVARARNPDPRLDLRVGSATEMPFADGSFDRVLALESAFHFDTRERFFREAFRVLRPGGRIATADLIPLLGRPTPRQRLALLVGRALWQIPAANMVDRHAYAEQLRAAGFADVRVESIRDDVFAPFKRYVRRRALDPEVVRRVHFALRRSWRSRNDGLLALDYVIATGTKPASSPPSGAS